MKRRSFLAMLGLAPVAAVPAVAATRAPHYSDELLDRLHSDISKHIEWIDDGWRMNHARIENIAIATAQIGR